MRWRTGRSLAAASALWACAGCSYDIGEADYPSRHTRVRMAMAEADLLKQQPAPDCQYRGRLTSDGASGEDAKDDARATLDYERQCYRHAEMIARDRLARLQSAMRQTTTQRSVRAEVRSMSTPN